MARTSALAAALLPLIGVATQAGNTFPVPHESYALAIDLSGCEIKENRPDGSVGRYVRAYCLKNSLNVSFWIKPAEKGGDSKVCRNTWWERESKSGARVSMRELGDLAVVDYAIGDGGATQQNVRAYLAYRETWIDIHPSRFGKQSVGSEEFDRLLGTVAMVASDSRATTPSKNDRSEELRLASRYYLHEDYRNAAIHYQKVVDAEKQSRTLDQTEWRVTVDNLAMAYGISGDFDRAAAVLQYGIAEDPTYPMFYYNLACTHAEQNDLPNAIAMLKKAFALKQNMIEGEDIPDPRTDSSFEKYLTNDAFQKALREIGA
jgi:tetratricopeptide (TPR) repeat protein